MAMNDLYHIEVKVDPGNIDVFNKILEGYDNLCIVTALRPERGEILVRVTPETRIDVIKILKHLPFSVDFTDSTDI